MSSTTEEFEYSVMMSNFAVLWLILHEIGHVQLGHFDEIVSAKAERIFNDRDICICTESSHGQNTQPLQLAHLRTCQEFAADTYATSKLFAIFMRRDAVKQVLPRQLQGKNEYALLFLMSASLVPVCIIQRMQKSVARGGDSPIGNYPDPLVRLFSVYATIWPILDNNQKYLIQMAAALNIPNVACDITHGQIMSAMLIHVALIDRLCGYVNSVPLLPWKLSGDLVITSDSLSFQGKVTYRDPGPDVIKRAEVEIVGAALSACQATARFDAAKNFAPFYSQWQHIIRSCHRRWSSQLDDLEIRGDPGAESSLTHTVDIHKHQLLSLFREIYVSSEDRENHERYAAAFGQLIVHLERMRNAYPATRPVEWC